ncbi:MAG: helix-turn-helix transcriptional regulator [Hungatella sp.]|nr:helix-turn-helix transcriptional regulator [Hungatella sp.]
MNTSKLMEAIGRKGMSLEALAKQADIDRSTIYHLQTGKNASPEVLRNLSCCLGIGIEELLRNPGDIWRLKRKIVEDHVGRADRDEVETIWNLIKDKFTACETPDCF